MAERRRERPGQDQPASDAPDDYDAPAADEDFDQDFVEEEDAQYDDAVRSAAADAEPDVFLDVPTLKVEEIDLEVDDLRAQVSLQANVLELLKLQVGVEVSLARVVLDIKGVDAVAQLKVRLDNVAAIITRVMETIDNNPQILENLTRGLGEAATGIGSGAGGALDEAGGGAGRAVEAAGEGAGTAVESVGAGLQESAGDIGEGAGRAVEGVIEDGGDNADEVRPRRRSGDSRRQARETDRTRAERPTKARRDRGAPE